MSSEPPRTTNEPPDPPGDDEKVVVDNLDAGRQTFEIMKLGLRTKDQRGGEPYPPKITGQLASEIKSLILGGNSYHVVLEGVKLWDQKGMHPSTLPSFVNQVIAGTTSPATNGNHKPFDSSTQNYESAVIR